MPRMQHFLSFISPSLALMMHMCFASSLFALFDQAALAFEQPATPASAHTIPKREWLAPDAASAKQINERSQLPPQVRIGLRLTPFKKVTTSARDGGKETRFLPAEPLRHTLRARLNKTNHFFVGEWHIETVPMKWINKTRRYEVRLNVFRRYGAFGQLEESLGSIDLAGFLEQQDERLFVLIGAARKRLRDKFQNPSLDIVAGFSAPEKPREVAKGPVSSTIPDQPTSGAAGGAILRGRF